MHVCAPCSHFNVYSRPVPLWKRTLHSSVMEVWWRGWLLWPQRWRGLWENWLVCCCFFFKEAKYNTSFKCSYDNSSQHLPASHFFPFFSCGWDTRLLLNNRLCCLAVLGLVKWTYRQPTDVEELKTMKTDEQNWEASNVLYSPPHSCISHRKNVSDQFPQTVFQTEISLTCLYPHLAHRTMSNANLGSTQRALLVPLISSSVGTDAVSAREKCVMRSTTAETELTNSHTTTVVSWYITQPLSLNILR